MLLRPFVHVLVPATLVAGGVAVAQVAGIRQETVQFAKGASQATIKGHLAGDQIVDYRVRAAAGQTLVVKLQETNPQNYFNVLPPGSNDVAMFNGQDGSDYQGVLPDDGDYTVRVYLMRPAARRKEKSDYTLAVGVTGKALRPLAASEDAVLSGTRFHASTTVPCTPPFATAPGQCEAFVIRRGRDGTGTVELRSKGTVVRRVLFVAGRPTTSDAMWMDALTFTRQGDTTVVSLGADERYSIPDVLVAGG